MHCILMGTACASFPDVVYGFLPSAAFALCLCGKANPTWLFPLFATTLASVFVLAYVLYRRGATAQRGIDAGAL